MINSPFYNISKPNEKKLTIVLLVLLPILIAVMLFFDRNRIYVRKLISFNILPLFLVLLLVSCKSENKKNPL
jgi:predicted membrane protein